MNSTDREGYFDARWRTAIGALILFKMWLITALPNSAAFPSPHDDWLFLNQAEHLLNGEWLGPYTHLTLAKGPMLPLFIAAVFVSGVSLSLAKAALYSAACALVALALRPLCRRRTWRFGLFAVLLFNPITYDLDETSRVLRQALLPPLVLLILASLLALYGRREQLLREQLPWATLLGLVLPAFWLTREESAWILPSVAPVWLYLLWSTWRQSKGSRVAQLGIVLVLPVCLWGTGLGVVALLNRHHYGVFTTCEFKHPSFKAAYGALLRAKHEREIPFVPVPRETCERIYAVSPAFSELRPYLEGGLGEAYAANSVFFTTIPPEQREIAGGWFVWAVREAVQLAGHARTGAEAMAFYERLAREVNEACDRGLLAARSRRSGFLPLLRWNQVPTVLMALADKVRVFSCFEDVSIRKDGPDQNLWEELIWFGHLTHTRLQPSGDPKTLAVERDSNLARLTVLQLILDGYYLAFPYTSAAATIALLIASYIAIARRRLPFLLVFSWGCAASVLVMATVIALMEVTCYPGIRVPAYLRGGYGMWLVGQFTSWLALVEAVGFRRRRGDPGEIVDGS